MNTRSHAFVSFSGILIAALISTAFPLKAFATQVDITYFRGAWSSTITYSAGNVVTYNSASYLCLVRNTGIPPSSSTTDWAILDAPGATGATGRAGPEGPAGPAGATGATGAQGSQGLMGPPGPFGPSGPAGSQGSAGVQGPAGPAGSAGATGSAGPQGPAGAQGPAGPAGTGGGFSYLNSWTSSTPYTLNNVVTESGTSYVALKNNSGVDPANDVRTSGGNWAIVAAAGAQGLAGAQGPAGPQGLQGITGPIGAQGLIGSTGPMGPAGIAGAIGAAGPTGATGATGATGPAGLTGATGATGLVGLTGPAGPAGPAGPQGPAGSGAAYTTCTTNITGPTTIQGNVVVPAGGYCMLGWVPPSTTLCCNPPIPAGYGVVSVTGSVAVGQGASLVVGLNSTIAGDIQAKNCNFVELVSEGNEEVDGNVQIFNCTGQPAFLSTGTGSVIYGNFQCLNNSGPCTLEEAMVGGAVQVLSNVTPSPTKIEADQIFGNLQCQNNSPTPTGSGSGNTVHGTEQGQCVGF